jgi:F-type H+-transporting ATPase subunit gamma
MAKTHDLKRRIRSIKNTMQVTKAMKMVSSARLRRAQERILAARPGALATRRVLSSLAARANPELHPLLMQRPVRRVEIVLITSDRGLCGSFNANLLKMGVQFVLSRPSEEVSVLTIGRRGRDAVRRRRLTNSGEWLDVFRNLEFGTARAIAEDLVRRYTNEEIDAVFVAYNEFKNVASQKPVIEQVLPVPREELREATQDYIYEPDPATLLDAILPAYVRMEIWRALLESAAAEHAARMTAMDSATKNAKELTDALTLHMNRVRQASITTEIIEVVSGAEALG